MNRQTSLIVGGVVLFIVLIFIFFVFLLPKTSRIFPLGLGRSITPTSVSANLNEILKTSNVPQNVAPLLGKSVLFTKNQVKAIINTKVFWMGALSGGKEMIVVSNKDLKLKAGDLVSVSGDIKNISDLSDQAKNWGLSQKDGEIIKQNPVYINATEVKVLQ